MEKITFLKKEGKQGKIPDIFLALCTYCSFSTEFWSGITHLLQEAKLPQNTSKLPKNQIHACSK